MIHENGSTTFLLKDQPQSINCPIIPTFQIQNTTMPERDNIYNEYKDRIGELLNGTVKRFERGDIIVDLGRIEAIIPRSQQGRHERYSQGDRIRAVIIEVHEQSKSSQIVLSRTSPVLLKVLFELEVPEIYNGAVIIKAFVREPGDKAKIAVQGVNVVDACTGTNGSRVQSIIRELRGEKIDIVLWSADLAVFITNALAPAKIKQIKPLTHVRGSPAMEVIVADDQLSTAIGKRGVNVRLAAELTGCKIDIKGEEEIDLG